MRKYAALTLFFLFFSSSAVSAHTGLETSTPAEGGIVSEEPREIVLEFNTDLESASTFTVTDTEGKEVPLDVALENQKMTGTPGAAMADGEYTVNWKITGADGHPIEGDYAFTLASEEPQADEAAEKATESPDAVQPVQTEPAESSYGMVLVLMVLMVVAAGTLVWAAQRRKN